MELGDLFSEKSFAFPGVVLYNECMKEIDDRVDRKGYYNEN
jgi:hypothetical protein